MKRQIFGISLLLLLMSTGSLWSQILDDPQIYVESQNTTTCKNISAPCGIDPNDIGDGSSIYVGFAGNHSAVMPLLILVGVPNGDAAPTLTNLPAGISIENPGVQVFELNHATTGTSAGEFEGTMASGGCKDAYSCSGITPNTGNGGGASESFVNWTTNPFPGGATNPDVGVTSFDLYAYAIHIALNSKTNPTNSPIQIGFGNTTAGSFVVAFSCSTTVANNGACPNGGIGDTPFTNAGFIDTTNTGGGGGGGRGTVPEPSSVALLASIVLGTVVLLKKRMHARS